MRLRKLTQAETNEIKRVFKRRVELYKEINEFLFDNLDFLYQKYVKCFQYSLWQPFTFSPDEQTKFEKAILGKDHSYRICDDVVYLSNTGIAPFKIINEAGYRRYDFDDSFVGAELLHLHRNAYWSLRAGDKVNKYIDIILRFGNEPYEPTVEDIQLIQKIRHSVNTYEKLFKEIKERMK